MHDTYLVMLDNGNTDGPYTAAELRGRLATGRVRSGDRLTVVATRLPCRVVDVVPEAQDISRVRPSVSDRIRHKTSDRLVVNAAQAHSTSELPASVPVPVPVPVPVFKGPEPAEYLAVPAEDSAAAAAGAAGLGRLLVAWAKPLAVVGVVVMALFLWMQLPAAPGKTLEIKDFVGNWQIGEETDITALKNAELVITLTDLTLSQGDKTRKCAMTLAAADDRVVLLALTPSDTELGHLFQLQPAPTGVRFMSGKGNALLIKQ